MDTRQGDRIDKEQTNRHTETKKYKRKIKIHIGTTYAARNIHTFCVYAKIY